MGRDHSCEQCGRGGLNNDLPCVCDLDELQRIAEKATPGPLSILLNEVGQFEIVFAHGECQYRLCSFGRREDAQFLTTANPPTVLALIARVRGLEKAIEQHRHNNHTTVTMTDAEALELALDERDRLAEELAARQHCCYRDTDRARVEDLESAVREIKANLARSREDACDTATALSLRIDDLERKLSQALKKGGE